MKPNKPLLAIDMFPDGPGSEAFQRGRRLTLEFSGDEIPVLYKIQYRSRRGEEPLFWEQNHPTQDFSWSDVPQALSLLFVDYLVWDKTGRQGRFYFTGSCHESHAASLGDTIFSGHGPIHELLCGTEGPGKPVKPHAKQIFYGDNVHGRATVERDRKITVSLNFLPPDCVAIFWQCRGKEPLSQTADLQLLAKRLRQSLNLVEPNQPAQPSPKPDEKKPAQPASPAKDNRPPSKPVETPRQYEPEDFPECFPHLDLIYSGLYSGYKPEEMFHHASYQHLNTTLERLTHFCNAVTRIVHPPDGRVIPNQFEVHPTQNKWPADLPIWSAGGEAWTLDEVTQGTLIFGATGSGKTSCSGRTLAASFLAKGFGGVILTTKPGEGFEWKLLCNALGREADVRWMRFDGPLKLNLLAYETQRPGAGAQLTENLIGFFKVLISVMGYRHGQRTNEGFWQSAGNQLLRNLFDLFLIAQEPLSLDRLADFVAAAPVKDATAEDAWRDVPLFGEVITAAENNSPKPADRRVVEKAKAYWLVDYPRLAAETRSCITFGFNAMLDVLRSRHIYELLCGETTITPETVFNGSIVILDLPVKDFGDAGLLVQCAFKYLFQRAVERRKNLGDKTRPVFLFVDEAQNFFTEYDTVFQQTARSSRIATVLLSQNVNNFYAHLGGDQNARYLFDSLAGNLNTRIFHANGDTLTNEWASKLFGTWDRPVESTSAATNPHHSLNPFDAQPPTFGRGMTTRREPLVPPEDFAKLRSGNTKSGFNSDAYIYRVGSVFQQNGLPFIKATFGQYRITEIKPNNMERI
jgi:hypothetical protein